MTTATTMIPLTVPEGMVSYISRDDAHSTLVRNTTMMYPFIQGLAMSYGRAAEIPSYANLIAIEDLFNHAQLDESRTCVVWNSNIDLPSDILYAYGKEVTPAASSSPTTQPSA